MEVLNGQEVFIAGLNPPLFLQGLALGAVPVSAGVVGYLHMTTTVALVLMLAQGCCSTYLDGMHDPQVSERQRVGSHRAAV